MHPPAIAVTLGDPRGIGPEVMLAALRRFSEETAGAPTLVLGAGSGPEDLPPGASFLSTGGFDGTRKRAGEVSLEALREGVGRCLSGSCRALVTGPVEKGALWEAGAHVPGQTELLMALTDAAEVGMLMASESSLVGGPLRVLLATTHVPLRRVPDLVTENLLVGQTRLLDRALRLGWGIPEPRLALCALNPHASDGGLFGDEEARVMAPAVQRLQDMGTRIHGPLSADTLFRRAASGEFDGVVAPYHDVGMAAFKSLAFGGGVNTTLGLPFPRTSPDHGTAFDLVGTGKADFRSALEALRLAHRLAGSSPEQ
jgi:4-hydroxythreonine-4-phosphate dehydrogenase